MKKPMELELDDVVRCVKTDSNVYGLRVEEGNIYRIVATRHSHAAEAGYIVQGQGEALFGYFKRSLFSDPLNREPYEHDEDEVLGKGAIIEVLC